MGEWLVASGTSRCGVRGQCLALRLSVLGRGSGEVTPGESHRVFNVAFLQLDIQL